ncbi:MAG: helix-turn-helix domain-containing protein [Prevotellaceae bacterium]|jgi:DNA-binding XRE family transcriptional regulator|nr:helix-turn-helix domain-containing protein [Prevotellaceae bacterium]
MNIIEQNRTRKWLAKTIGENKATMSRWCTNETQSSVETFVQIAKILNIDTGYLFNTTK